MESWRSAWRSLREAAGLKHVRFRDGRHTALTRLCEAGQPDWVIQAQMGHVSPSAHGSSAPKGPPRGACERLRRGGHSKSRRKALRPVTR